MFGFSTTYWRRVAEAFAVAAVPVFLAQLAGLQDAVVNRDWSTARSLASAAAIGAVTAGAQAVWLAYRAVVDAKAKRALTTKEK